MRTNRDPELQKLIESMDQRRSRDLREGRLTVREPSETTSRRLQDLDEKSRGMK